MKRGLLLLWLLALAACAPLRELPPQTAATLAAGVWPAGGETWVLRQSALFELRGARMPMRGVVRLDPGRQARLAGLDDLGVKLFDITATPEGEEVHFLLPELARFPGAAQAIAASLRRIYLAPAPTPADRLSAKWGGWLLERREGEARITFRFAGPEPVLVEKRAEGGGEDWRVRYFDYRPVGAETLPGRIVLDDFGQGYRLSLWLDEARKEERK